MIVWTIVAFYVVGYVISFRRIAGQMAWHYAENGLFKSYDRTPTGEHWFGAIAAGFLLSLVWPLSLPIAYGIAAQSSGLFYTPPEVRERFSEEARRESDERIRQLEREAGINS